jgi:hypothetical protein
MAKVIFPILETQYAAEIEGLHRRLGRIPVLAALYAGGPEEFLFSTGD